MNHLKSAINDEGILEYYLDVFDTYESINQLLPVLAVCGVTSLKKLDGIYSRIALCEKDGKRFKIIFHEDVGTYVFSPDGSAPDDWLYELLVRIIAIYERAQTMS